MKLRIAAFGFRSVPPLPGSAGADKFAEELFVRLAERGHKITAYNRIYKKLDPYKESTYKGIQIKSFKTVNKVGFDTLLHSFKCTFDIIFNNTGDIVHIQNGGNSFWAIFLRLFRKKVFISQDGIDWKRDKWLWYGKIYLILSTWITAYVPNRIIFDNIFARKYFENKFHKKFDFIPFGSEVKNVEENISIFRKLGIEPKEYILFVGRFIPDKGLHYLIPAFSQIKTNKKLLLIGGSPNQTKYESEIQSATDKRIIFPGYIYGNDAIRLMKNAYLYIQPSDIEGLSPVILMLMGLQTPLLVSDIEENIYVVKDTSLTFKQGNIEDLRKKIEYSLENPEVLNANAKKSYQRAKMTFSWESVTDQHINIFLDELKN